MSLSFTLNADDASQLLDFLLASCWDSRFCITNEKSPLPQFMAKDDIQISRTDRGMTFMGSMQVLDGGVIEKQIPSPILAFKYKLEMGKDMSKPLHALLPKKGRSKNFLRFTFITKGSRSETLEISNSNSEKVEIKLTDFSKRISSLEELSEMLLEKMTVKNSLTYNPQALLRILNTVLEISDIVELATTPSRQTYRGESEIVTGEFRIDNSGEPHATNPTFIEPSKLVLAAKYMQYVVENAVSDSIKLTFMSNFPIYLESDSTSFKQRFIIAPRVTDTKEDEENFEKAVEESEESELDEVFSENDENPPSKDSGIVNEPSEEEEKAVLAEPAFGTGKPKGGPPEKFLSKEEHTALVDQNTIFYKDYKIFPLITRKGDFQGYIIYDPKGKELFNIELKDLKEDTLETVKKLIDDKNAFDDQVAKVSLEEKSKKRAKKSEKPRSETEKKLHPLPAIYQIIDKKGYMNPETGQVSLNTEYKWKEVVSAIAFDDLNAILRKFTYTASSGDKRAFTEKKLMPVIGVECLRQFRKEVQNNKNLGSDILLDRGGTLGFYEKNYTGIPKVIQPFITSEGFTNEGLAALKIAVVDWIAEHEIQRDRVDEKGKKILDLLNDIKDINSISATQAYDIYALEIPHNVLEIAGIGPGTGQKRSFGASRPTKGWSLGKSFVATGGKASGKLVKKLKNVEAKIQAYFRDVHQSQQEDIDDTLNVFHFKRDDIASLIDGYVSSNINYDEYEELDNEDEQQVVQMDDNVNLALLTMQSLKIETFLSLIFSNGRESEQNN